MIINNILLPKQSHDLDDKAFRTTDSCLWRERCGPRVDDEALVRMLAVDALREEGFTVYEAADAREALSLMDRQGDVTLVVSDIDMPGMSGVELAREIGRRRPQVRFLLTSGRGCPDRLPPGGRFLAKPYTSAALSAQLRWPV